MEAINTLLLLYAIWRLHCLETCKQSQPVKTVVAPGVLQPSGKTGQLEEKPVFNTAKTSFQSEVQTEEWEVGYKKLK